MTHGIGPAASAAPIARVDGRAKVTGRRATRPSIRADDLLYGVVVTSTDRHGPHRRASTPTRRWRCRGVLDVLTHENRPPMPRLDLHLQGHDGAAGGSPFRPLHDDRIHYSGQPIALVVAETFEAARYARVAGAGELRGRAARDRPRGRASAAPTSRAGARPATRRRPSRAATPTRRFAARAGQDRGRVLRRRRAPQPDGDARDHGDLARPTASLTDLRQDAGRRRTAAGYVSQRVRPAARTR